MNSYISITCRTFTIWLLAAVINGLLCGIYLGISGYEGGSIISLIFLAGICSVFFAIPGFFIFWLIMLLMISRKLYGRSLFRVALSTGIVLASITALFSIKMFSFPPGLAVSLSIILSSIASIMMHFNFFKKQETKEPGGKNQLKLY